MNLQIDYDGLGANAATATHRVTQLMAREGLKVVEVKSDGRTRRTAGISYREVTMAFADSQHLLLRVKSTGDVYQVLVNGKVVPIKAQDDPSKAVAELVTMLDTGRARFQKRLAMLQMRPPPGLKTAAPKLRDALKAQIAQVDEQIDAAREELAAMQVA